MNECVWSIGGMILTGENQSTERKPCPGIIFYTTNYVKANLQNHVLSRV
jgi:hypothetical protein